MMQSLARVILHLIFSIKGNRISFALASADRGSRNNSPRITLGNVFSGQSQQRGLTRFSAAPSGRNR
jgi:hypothetical protein